jgi:hypothetical protein
MNSHEIRKLLPAQAKRRADFFYLVEDWLFGVSTHGSSIDAT